MIVYPQITSLLTLLNKWNGDIPIRKELHDFLLHDDVIIRSPPIVKDNYFISAIHLFSIYDSRQKLQEHLGNQETVIGYKNLLPALKAMEENSIIQIVKVITNNSVFSIFLLSDFQRIIGVLKSNNNNKEKMLDLIKEWRIKNPDETYFSNR